MQFHFNITLDRPRSIVWKAFDNPENLHLWQPTLVSYTQDASPPNQAVARATLCYEEHGSIITATETIILRREPEIFDALFETSCGRSLVKNRFTDINEQQTRWDVFTEFQFKGIWRLLSFFYKREVPQRTQADLKRFKELLENNTLAS